MIIDVPTKESLTNELQKIVDENVFQILNYSNITKIRNEFYQIILKARRYSVDTSDIFPVVVKAASEYIIKFYQNGDVYMFEPNKNIIHLYNDYRNDSICRNE